MKTEYKKLKNLFLRQSCQDAWEDYARSIRKVNFPRWDYVILTSSNEEQARSFRSQIADRLEQGVLPGWTKYFVLPDPEGKRVGSGGATLNVLRFLSEEEGLHGDFHNKRILVIHSGGDSKRVPQYSVCGKLFSPVPRELPDGRGSTLFDEFLISMAGVPARFKEGMLVLSGDVLLLFNPLQIDAQFRGAAAISMKSPIEVGVDHGVFLNDGNDHVKMFLHKQPEETLRKLGAVNGQDCVDLDTGAVLLDAEILGALFNLIADKTGKNTDPDKYETFVNEKARVSFYGDFLYPLAADSTFEQYQKEKPEGEFCEELFSCREKIWEALSPYQMKLICLSPAEFIHFGTTRELRALMTEEVADYEFLDWKKHVFTNAGNCAGALHTALIAPETEVEEGTYIEDSCLEGRSHIGKGAVVSGLFLKDICVPENTVFHAMMWFDKFSCKRSDLVITVGRDLVETVEKEGFKAVHEYLVNGGKSCMAGFVLKNTLSDNGGVTRGICKMDEENNLTEVVETKDIVKTANGAEADGVAVDVNSLVSMNMWGLTPDFLDVLEQGFKEFFEKEVPENPLKAEYLIPIFIGELLEQGKMSVKVLKTNDTWYGMTYHEDVAAVKDSFKKMLENGVYKADLFADL